jgi:catechol-2,3-dioxygenase
VENSSTRVEPSISGFAELTLETGQLPRMERFYRDVTGLEVLAREDDRVWLAAGDRSRLRGPVEHPGGDQSIYFRDPAGNLVEAWDFFAHGDGARQGVQALA